MKKLNVIILLGILQISLNAQPYIPMPTTKAVWTISTVSFGVPTAPYKYGMYGDTIINNRTYKKIYQNFDNNFDITNSVYRGAIREFGKKVYKVNPGTTTEGILYDFTLAIGDTARSIDYYGNINKKKVTGYNFIVYNGIMHRKWIFQSTGEFWLEGIGSSFGLFDGFVTPTDVCRSLVCLSIDATVQYQNASPACSTPIAYNCDGGFVGINELLIDNSRSIIFPNPISSSAILQTNIELNDGTLKVYDVLGQEVLTNTHLNGQEIKINRENLSSGNYYYKLTQKNVLISTGKLIIE